MKVIQKFLHNNLRNFNYIVYSEENRDAIFIDPYDLDQLLPVCRELKLNVKYILLTHKHHDHIRNYDKFLSIDGTEEIFLKDEEFFSLSSSEKLHCFHTPGHVSNHYCYKLEDQRGEFGIITGDTIFNAGVGNCKNGGTPHILAQTIKDKFITLEDELIIYPSHDYLKSNLEFSLSIEPENKKARELLERRLKQDLDNEFIETTIGIEKEINPFFRCYLGKLNHKFFDKTEKDIFIELRRLRDNW